ncbi:hypothetical protein PPL_07618 [Heterostelium album PN500]|uniref:Uncharacterized protein n=1 Tax=Heterostelium pallidum (strain ATCC 26659 / Pp 5 / PN500) TaxID=670386 RepID=D3BGG7_HETP5|nr:hypothetical protein PPL_07618 [Heterostelium album PN500]EFA79567.1 hypothetical protein PPL_07618 [Heterostelium album PN500]|eukprot:XP_020431688.1 hypothetical protein PPL_07618 [Heterostelium album PN500]
MINIFKKQSIFLFIVLASLIGVESQWITEAEYSVAGCNANGVINRVSAYLINTCYSLPGANHKFVVTGTQVTKYQYSSAADCSGTATTTEAYSFGVCYDKIIYGNYPHPPVLLDGWAGFERVPYGGSPCTSVYEASRHTIKQNACVSMSDFPGTTALVTGGVAGSTAIASMYVASCAISNPYTFNSCNSLNIRLTGFMAATTNTFTVSPPTINGYTLSFSSFAMTSSKYTYYYLIEYLNPNTNTWVQTSYTNQPSGPVSITVPPLPSTQIRFTARTYTLIGGYVQSYTTISYTLAPAPDVNTINIDVLTTKTITFSYSATNNPTSFAVTFNGVARPECSTKSSCAITNLTPGSDYTIGIIAKNAAGTSPEKIATGKILSQVSAPVLNIVPSQNKMVVSYTTTGGIPGLTLYTTSMNGAIVTGCNGISQLSCTVTGLPAFYSQKITVAATNDGFTITSNQDVDYIIPTMNPIQVTTVTTKTITFTYTASMSPTSFEVKFNNVVRPECASMTSCTLANLTPGSAYSISITATNIAGTSPAVTASGSIYALVAIQITTVTPTPNQIVVAYSSTGGIPTQTRFTTTLNGTEYAPCKNIATTQCTITGLAATFTYTIGVSAINDGYTASDSELLEFYPPTLSPITINSFRTKSITFSYSATFSPTSYTVLFNGAQRTECSTMTSCSISGLTPGSPYSISVTALNAAGSSGAQTASGNLYNKVSVPTISTVPAPNEITVTYQSSNGVPGETVYTTQVDGKNVASCVNIASNQCKITGLGAEYNVLVAGTASNDGDSQSNTQQVTYLSPVMNPLQVSFTTNLVQFDYSASRSPTSYNVYFNSIIHPECAQTTTCTIRNLTPGSSYSIAVSATNNVGTSDNQVASGNIYPSVSEPTISPVAMLGKIIVNYLTTGGVPTETTYTTKLDGDDVPGCVNIATLTCTIGGLDPNYHHDITVVASNDGYSKQSTVIVDFFAPVMESVTIQSYRTKSISFNYSATNYPTSYNVRVNQIAIPECSTTTSCSVSQLVPGSAFVVEVSATNAAGASSDKSTSGNLYPTITTPELETMSYSDRIVANYNSDGGVPTETLYTIKMNGTEVTDCTGTTKTRCEITGLQQPFIANISVVASNDGDSKERTREVKFIMPILSPIVINSIGISSINFTYSTTNSPSSTFIVSVNGELKPECELVHFCFVSGLVPGSNVSISVIARNQDGQSDPVDESVTLYSLLNLDVYSVPQSQTVYVTYNSTGGVPNQTTYTTKLDGTDVIGCINTIVLACNITGLKEAYTHNITVISYNDGYSKSQSIIAKYVIPLEGSTITFVEPHPYLITVEWSESVGGEDFLTFYDLYISIDNTSWVATSCRNLQTLNCEIVSLTSDTQYYIRLAVKNTVFNPIYSYSSTRTLKVDLVDQCSSICVQGTCNNKTGTCVCNAGWGGPKCDIKYETNPPIITPDPTTPEVIVDNGIGYYSFTLSKIIERSELMEEVFSVELSTLKWVLSKNDSTIIEHPIDHVNVSMNQWVYSTNQTRSSSIRITFTQINPPANVSLSDFPMNFAGEDFNLTMGSLKYQIDIDHWNFTSVLNLLEIQLSIDSEVDECYDAPESIFVNGTELTGISIPQANGNVIYGRISRRALLDGVPRMSNVVPTTVNQSLTIISTLVSNFQESMVIDPDFSLLIDPMKSGHNKCTESKNDNKWKIIVGCVVGGVAAIGIAAVTTVVVKKNRMKNIENKRVTQKLQKLRSPQS